ncbi:MAG: DNA polymerase III subunit delta [Lachnospiraceae bacterium]|nr:DNA polymerase III subunit delta [Lachnospiraceae bacterium]
MGRISDELKSGQYSRIYLVYGEEAYLKRYYKNRLVKALSDGPDSINFNYYQGEDINVTAVIDQAETMPFFADHRLILVEDSKWFKKAGDDAARLAEYLPRMPQETILVFVENEVDVRTKLFKTVKELGCAEEQKRQTESSLKNWVLGRIKREQVSIQRSAMDLFIRRTGDDMNTIEKELEKLICYAGPGGSIMLEDVEALTTAKSEDRIFELVDAAALGKRERALKLYWDMLALRESPLRLLALLARQFERIAQVKELRDQGMDQGTIVSKTGIRDFIVRGCLAQAACFKTGQVEMILRLCIETEEDIKQGRITDRTGVEILLQQIMGLSDQNRR